MRSRLIIFLFALTYSALGQLPISDAEYVNQLNLSGGFPPKLLATRTAVFYSFSATEKEMVTLQDYCVRTGIDAELYLPIDILTAGSDITKAVVDFLTKREISNVIFAEKNPEGFRITVTSFSGKENIVEKGQAAWSATNRSLAEVSRTLNRSALAELKRENLLINEFPETEAVINPIIGKRNEFYAADMKVDLVAIPKFGNETMDKQMDEILASNFPFNYKLVEPTISEKDLRKQGFFYIMKMVHTRAQSARDLLGYKESKPQSAIVSVTFPEAQLQLKSIPSNTVVFKVYFKHIDSGNVFLGTKWDADLTWQQALLNNIRGMKAELRIN